MRGVSTWSVATRREDGEIEVASEPIRAWTDRHRLLRLPVVRGVVALAQSLEVGLRALAISAAVSAGTEEGSRAEPPRGVGRGLTIAAALAFAIGLFFVLPAAIALLLGGWLETAASSWVVESGLRVGVLVGYVVVIGRLGNLRRMFEYHGAEHKAIACVEGGEDLTPDRAAAFSRLHPRCGTSFLLVLMVVASILYVPFGFAEWYWVVLSRVLGVPLAAGLSYEALKWMGKHRRAPLARALIWPGVMLQNLTTREPDEGQLEVAIAALEPVLAIEGSDAAPAPGAPELVA